MVIIPYMDIIYNMKIPPITRRDFGNLEIIVSVVLNEKEDSIERLFFARVFCQNTHIFGVSGLFVLFIKIIVRFDVSAGVAWFVFSEMP